MPMTLKKGGGGWLQGALCLGFVLGALYLGLGAGVIFKVLRRMTARLPTKLQAQSTKL